MSLSSALDPRRSLEQRRQAAANLYRFLVGGGLADETRIPSDVIDDGPQRTVRRYRPATDATPTGVPVPPLGSPATCMDRRRGCSLAEHLVTANRPTYLVDYGEIGFNERKLGLEHSVSGVLPAAIRAVSDDAAGAPVALLGWCMGGLLSLLSTAAYPQLPVAAVAMVASPFDFSTARLLEPLRDREGRRGTRRRLRAARDGRGTCPARRSGFKLLSLPTYLKKPPTVLRNRDDRDFLAHIEAVD
jgi:polyhydroxyalkanoate synthase